MALHWVPFLFILFPLFSFGRLSPSMPSVFEGQAGKQPWASQQQSGLSVALCDTLFLQSLV